MNDRTRAVRPARGPDDAFYELIVRYMDNQATIDDLALIEQGLVDSPKRRQLFLDVFLQVAFVAESGVPLLPNDPVAHSIPQSAADSALKLTRKTEKPEVVGSSWPVPTGRSPVLGFLHSLSRVGYETPMANALMWLVMAIVCSGIVLTVVLCIVLTIHGVGVNVHVDGPGLEGGKWTINGGKASESNAVEGAQAADGMKLANGLSSRSDFSTAASRAAVPGHSGTVARLIHAVDCCWASGPRSPHLMDDLEPGRKLVLLSGLAEVMFQSGVRTLLQGPATMEIGSRMSARLHQGKLTVRIEDPDAHGFEVYAPGMKYTDLGTEFGVWVAKDGTQEMCVFRGQVQAEAAPREIPNPKSQIADWKPENPNTKPLILTANQAIRIPGPSQAMERIAGDEKRFVRALPATVPFPLFSTGAGLERGAIDPHWELVDIDTESNFQPREAVVAVPPSFYLKDSPDTAQWISKSKELEHMPFGCRLTFRTRFDLTGFDASTARISGQISADDYVAEIRLNGKVLPVPRGARDEMLFAKSLEFKIEEGFVPGDNTLEIVVENATYRTREGIPNSVALCVNCQGKARPLLTPTADD